MKELTRWLTIITMATILLVTAISSCSKKSDSLEYEAEKKLFKARKLKEELLSGPFRQEFFDKTINAYRKIVKTFKPEMKSSHLLKNIVVSSQLEMADLFYMAGQIDSALAGYRIAIKLAKDIPQARAGAIYTSAAIAEEAGKLQTAIDLYREFTEQFLIPINRKNIALIDRSYLIAPIKLAQLLRSSGKRKESKKWFEKAEKLYKNIISAVSDTTIKKTSHFNLLSTYLESRRWKDALNLAEELKKLYPDSKDVPSLDFIIAQIYRDGLNKREKAYDKFLSIRTAYPESKQAPLALLAAANIKKGEGNYKEAAKLYREIIKLYPDNSAIIEAEWQLAQLEEAQGNWVEASLRYKSIYSKYPASIQGLEAPIRIMKYYIARGQNDAARAAYEQALQHYSEIASKELPVESKLMAEEYAVRAMIELGDWEKAIERLTELPSRYPFYERFRGNYLYAASICEKELKDKNRAIEILKECVKKYPGTSLADEAEKQIERLGG